MKNKSLFFLLLFLIIASAIEIYNLDSISLWHDEAFSALLTRYDIKEMVYRTGLDVHPPFYYLALKAWAPVFGDSLFSLRLPSVIFSIVSVLIFYFLVKKVFQNKNLALFTSILLAFNSFFMQFAMEMRMFALGNLLIIASTYLLIKSLESKKITAWILYAITICLAIYTHYYTVFSIAAQGIYFLYHIFQKEKFKISQWFKNQDFQKGTLSYILAAIFYIPWLKTFLFQVQQVQESYWIPEINIWSIPNTFFKLTTGLNIDPSKYWYILLGLMGLVLGAIVFSLKESKTKEKWLFFSLLTMPFVGAGLMSVKSSIYLDRYFIFVLPFYLLFLAISIFSIKNKTIKNILIVVTVLANMVAFPIYWSNLNVNQKPGMAGASEYLNQNVDSEDKIYVGSSFIYFTFKYYNQTNINPLLFAPNELSHFSGTALLTENDVIKNFSQAKQQDIVWVINTTGFGNYQLEVPNTWIELEKKGFQDVHDYRGWIIVSKYLAN